MTTTTLETLRQESIQMVKNGLSPTITKENTYLVPAKANTKITFKVTANNSGWLRCTCPTNRSGHICKHILFVTAWLRKQKKKQEQPKRTYTQNWTAYNTAQKKEIDLFDKLLSELVSTIEEPEQTGRGRPRLTLKDVLFCSIQKVYSQLSSRRAHLLFERAEGREQVDHAPHYNAISKILLREDITPLLHHLIKVSAAPLAGIETGFAVDSSGFRTTRFNRYCGEKHGELRKNIWLKAHISSGVKTNIVTDVSITDGHGGDSPEFGGLVLGTSERFEIEEVSGDKAYSSRYNHELVGKLGGQALIPFKKNATGRAGRSAFWKKAFHYFQFHREEFEERYHKRSNVESTFGAIKAKFGETLKSKKYTAQVDELLCKILAYNITVLIKEMFVCGINPDFLTLKSAA